VILTSRARESLSSFFSKIKRFWRKRTTSGLKRLNIESMITARRVICLKKYLEDYPSTWKSILNSCILPVGGSLVLHCNFDTVKLKTQFPKCYKECFDAWSGLNSSTPVTFNDIMNEIIWNNKFICIDKKSVCRNDLVNLGIVKVGDLITDNNLFLLEDPYVPISLNNVSLLWESFTLFHRTGKRLLDLLSVKMK